MDVRFCGEQEPSAEAYLLAVNPESLECALSRARPGHLRFSIDKDLHGCPSFGSYRNFLQADIALPIPCF
jgi:hypothetical protein